MTALGSILRWINLAPGLLLVGTFAALLLAGPHRPDTARRWEARCLRGARVLVLVLLASGLAVLAYQAAYAAGRPGAALDPAEWGRVLFTTQFGTVWLVRHGLLLLLVAFLLSRQPETGTADWAAFRGEAAVLAGLGAAALAWAGHAAAVETASLVAALVDALHLVAAGAWLGALLPLALLLREASTEDGADSRPVAVVALRRFSALALPLIAILVATGVWTTWTQVGDVPALIGTRYGRLLGLKVLLLGAILVVAAVSRRRLLPALGGEAATVGRPAMRRLAGFVTIEWALGLAILAVVSVLATTPPGRHDVVSWPFSFRLDWDAMAPQPGVKTRAFIGSQIALLGVIATAAGALLARWRAGFLTGGVAAIALGLWVALPPLAVDAYPTTYVRPQVAYTALSIAAGRDLYAAHCATCHGAGGQGDGPGAAGLAKRPADLTAPHTGQHTAGDIFWWISRGIPAAGMPAFGDRLTTEERWDLINFVRALASSEQARGLAPRVEPDRPWLAAPDFAYSVGPVVQGTLRDFRGRQPVLLVLFSLPASRPRLERLAAAYDSLRGIGLEVLAAPLDGGDGILGRLGAVPPIMFPVVTEGSAEIARAYSLFARTLEPDGLRPGPAPQHMELLIDRGGYVRARWIPAQGKGWADPGALVPELQQMAREAPAPPPTEHVH
ncbi:MAG: CopD family protein [Candidatus Rokuibacteriota bacterium]